MDLTEFNITTLNHEKIRLPKKIISIDKLVCGHKCSWKRISHRTYLVSFNTDLNFLEKILHELKAEDHLVWEDMRKTEKIIKSVATALFKGMKKESKNNGFEKIEKHG